MNPLLSLELDAWYGAAPSLRGLRLEMAAGEVLGLVGASGSGKSTLTLALLRLLGLKNGRAAGRIVFDGRDLMTLDEKHMRRVRGREIALVPQSPLAAFNPALRLRAHFEEAWRAHAVTPWPAQETKTLERLAELGLPAERAFLDRRASELSVGQAQRVWIALALLHEPKLLIADEPTSALDPLSAAEALRLFRDLNERRGVAILYISHDLLSVAGLCHRVAILESGALVECDTTARIFNAPREAYTRRLVDAIPKLPSQFAADSLALATALRPADTSHPQPAAV